MSSVDVRPVGAGAGVSVVGYFLVTAVAVPATLPALLAMPAPVAAAVLLLATCLPLALGGVLTTLALRRRREVRRRADVVPTALVSGATSALVVSAIGAAAAVQTGEALVVPALVTTLVVFCAVHVAAAVTVPPRRTGRAEHGYAAPRPAVADAGQGSVEALGTTAVAVVLVLALVMAVTPGGRWLTESIRVQLCRLVTLGQGDCGEASLPSAADREEPEHACTITDTRDNRSMAVSVTWVQAENGDLIRIEELAGGTYRVSREISGGVGGQIGAGGGVSITVDDATFGAEAQAGVSATALAGGGMTWVVDEAERDRLVDHLKSERDWNTFKQVLSSSAGPAGTVVGWMGDAGRGLWNWATGGYDPGLPDEVYGHVGVHGAGSGSAAGVLGSASGQAETTAVVGARADTATGRTTVYYSAKVDASLGVQQHVVSAGEASASGTVELLVAVTYDPDGHPLNVQAQGMAAGSAKLQASMLFGDPFVDENPAAGAMYDARVSVTGEESLRIAEGFLRATGITTKDPVSRWDGAQSAVGTFMDAARERGTFTRQDAAVDGTTSFAFQAGGEIAGVGLGAQFGNSAQTLTTSNPQYWNGRGWADWTGCAS